MSVITCDMSAQETKAPGVHPLDVEQTEAPGGAANIAPCTHRGMVSTASSVLAKNEIYLSSWAAGTAGRESVVGMGLTKDPAEHQGPFSDQSESIL
eukprot:SAG11_NODE_30146_length_303_cov_1.759804_1_plen_95_part_10